MLVIQSVPETTVKSFLLVVMIILMLSLPLLFYLKRRNDKVLKFELELIQLCYEYNMRHVDEIIQDSNNNAYNWCYDILPSYRQKVFSFKKLTLKSYLTPEQYNRLNS